MILFIFYIITGPALVANTDMGWGYSSNITTSDVRLSGYAWGSTSYASDRVYLLTFYSSGYLGASSNNARVCGFPIHYIPI